MTNGPLASRSSRARELAVPLCYCGLRAIGLPAVTRRLQDAGLVLCYHNVVDASARAAGDPAIHMPRDRFENQIRWLTRHYTVIPLSDFVDRVSRGKSM